MNVDLLSFKHGVPAWITWGLLTIAAMSYTALTEPLLLDTPLGALLPLAMLTIWWVWMLAGASAGWLPRP